MRTGRSSYRSGSTPSQLRCLTGHLHRAGLTGHPDRRTHADLDRSRKRFRLRTLPSRPWRVDQVVTGREPVVPQGCSVRNSAASSATTARRLLLRPRNIRLMSEVIENCDVYAGSSYPVSISHGHRIRKKVDSRRGWMPTPAKSLSTFRRSRSSSSAIDHRSSRTPRRIFLQAATD